MNNLNCINCGADTTRKVSAVYSEGAQVLSGQTTNSGMGIGLTPSGPAVGLGGSEGTFSGTLSTNLSQQLAPPFKMSYWSIIKISFIVMVIGQISLALLDLEKIIGFFSYILLFFTTALLIYSIFYNFKIYPKEFKAWDKLFYCNRCDTTFEPKG